MYEKRMIRKRASVLLNGLECRQFVDERFQLVVIWFSKVKLSIDRFLNCSDLIEVAYVILSTT